MQSSLIFNVPNIVFWVALAVAVWAQGLTVGRRPLPGFRSWPELQRWLYGFDTLFGSSLAMVYWFGWSAQTWAVLALATLFTRLAQTDYALVGSLWKRRESHRWTLQYFTAFLIGLICVVAAGFDLVSWILMFASLGVCGAVKVGCEAYRESVKARQLRRQGVHRNGSAY